MLNKVYIVILNWNGWQDTIECLESVFKQNYENFQVVVCDNGSKDESISHIKAWAEGKEICVVDENSALQHLSTPAVIKPINYSFLTRDEAERVTKNKQQLINAPLTLIQTGANLGFAGGNNVGLRYALAQGDADYLWLLNNDTVIENDCLSNMVNYSNHYPAPNICGSQIIFYDNPEIVQALGGNKYNKWTGIASTTLGRGLSIFDETDHCAYEKQLDYITGASLLVPKSFIEEIGLMEESYFLYNEEIDWCVRNQGKYALCYAPKAKVYHKEGSSIGSPTGERPSSLLADFYLFRNKLKFTWKHYPEAIISTYLATFLQAINRARRGQWDKARLIMSILLGKKDF